MINDEIIVPVNKQINNFNGIVLSYKVELTSLKDNLNVEIDISSGEKKSIYIDPDVDERKNNKVDVPQVIGLPIVLPDAIVDYCFYQEDVNLFVMFFYDNICYKTRIRSFSDYNGFLDIFYNFPFYLNMSSCYNFKETFEFLKVIFAMIVDFGSRFKEMSSNPFTEFEITKYRYYLSISDLRKVVFRKLNCVCCKSDKFQNLMFDGIIRTLRTSGLKKFNNNFLVYGEKEKINQSVMLLNTFFEYNCKHVFQFYNEESSQRFFESALKNFLVKYVCFNGDFSLFNEASFVDFKNTANFKSSSINEYD